jgi:hypothetical protein
MRRLDETRRLRAELPASARVRVVAGEAEDELEARVLVYRRRRSRVLGDIVKGLLEGGDADEYDALKALQRLVSRGIVHVKTPHGTARSGHPDPSEPPQPELER